MSDEAKAIYERLSARFPTDDHRRVNKGGGDQTYVPAEKVISRLNNELGLDGWSFEVIREGFTATEAWVLGQITADIAGTMVTRQQYGNEPIVMGRAERPTADLLKKAGTDSLKKCATLLGVAAYLYDEDERHDVEAAMQAEKAAQAKADAEARRAAQQKPRNPACTHPSNHENACADCGMCYVPGPDGKHVCPSASPAQAKAAGTAKANAAAVLTGAPETVQQRWARLVAEAERFKLPRLPQIKAIAPEAVGAAQLKQYADRLEGQLKEAKGAA